jgi:hypothetical protein
MMPRFAIATIALLALGVIAACAPDSAEEKPQAVSDTDEASSPQARAAEQSASSTGTGTISGEDRHQLTSKRAAEPRSTEGYPDRRGQAMPGKRPDPAKKTAAPTVPPTSEAGRPGSSQNRLAQAAASASDFTVFRNTVTGTSGTSAVEPTAANDRNGVLVTGNFYANVSRDNGLTFDATPLDPSANEVYGGFCCDQVAYAVDRGSYSLVFWLIQYRYKAAAQRNALKLRMFRGRSDLLDKEDSCSWNFEPQRDFERDTKQWLDFNQVSHTSKYLYITTNVRDADKATLPQVDTNDPRVGGLIFRIALDDLDDGNCKIDYRYWYEKGNPYISPVQNAGSTMYLATHVPGFLEGDNLRIYSIADSSTDLKKKDKDIENFKDIDGHCPLPDGKNPCKDAHNGRMSGFRSGNTIGWLWMGDEDKHFPFPHVRAAVFETGTLKKVLEHQIWSNDFAWQLPTVGVNQKGDLGVILYAMGGGRFPKVQGFILTDPRNWSGIQMNAIAPSTSGADADGWGHYASVRPYGNCTDTYLGSAYTSEGGVQRGRLVWFGRKNDGCADLAVTTLLALPTKVTRGNILSITQITRNIGSATASASTTRYYLSRDATKSSDDIRLNAETSVPALSAENSVTGPVASATVPTNLSGEYRLFACADDRSAVSEITDTNNCFLGVQTITVQ